MKIKVSKHKFNIYRGSGGSPWGSRTQQHTYCLRYAHSQHIECHLAKKQPQAKLPIEFLFSQLHFNNVTSHALFYGGHLVMRGKRCAVQDQAIALNQGQYSPISWGWFGPRAEMEPTVGWNSLLIELFWPKLCSNGSRKGWIRLWPAGLN